MRPLQEACAAMAAQMLDDELVAIHRRTPGRARATPLQQAVAAELRRRQQGSENRA